MHDKSKSITFSYRSPSISIRQIDYEDNSPDVLIQFNYFKQVSLDWPSYKRLISDFERVLTNSHFKYSVLHQYIHTSKIKKISNKTIKKLISQQQYLTVLEDGSELAELPVARFLSKSSSNFYFPNKLYVETKELNFDTNENRFIKFFFEHVQNIALRLNSIKGLPAQLHNEKNKVLLLCRQILSNPFFKEIGQLTSIPHDSTVLHGRAGYQEIYEHYTRSRFGIRSILDEFNNELLSQDLKKISDLYEYWVFIKIAHEFLGDEIVIEQQEAVINSRNISYGVCFESESISIYYNWTESRTRNTSYSLTLRPDTTVKIVTKEKTIKLIFDAKYKVQTKSNEEDISRYVKPEDIYKMHTYLDSISDVEFAMVVYPGTEFYFYEKDTSMPIRRAVEDIKTLKGVGAIPLVPNDPALEIQFKGFINKLKKEYLIN
jgi:hypothetical protein